MSQITMSQNFDVNASPFGESVFTITGKIVIYINRISKVKSAYAIVFCVQEMMFGNEYPYLLISVCLEGGEATGLQFV